MKKNDIMKETKNKEIEMKPIEKVVFTTAQNQASLNSGFLRNLELFIETNKIDKVYIFAVKGRYVTDNKAFFDGDDNENSINKFGPHDSVRKLLVDGLGGAKVEIIYNTKKNGLKINDNLSYFHTQMLPQVVDPFRGLSPKLLRDKSYIVNAPKVRFEVLGTNNPKSPRTITSTGAITNPRYRIDNQTGAKALEMHTFGFTYIEIFNSKRFNLKPIMANQKGSFSYLDKKYVNGKQTTNKTKALILGDIHRAVIDKGAMAESRQQIKLLKPKYVVLHDIFDMSSINHHTSKSFLSQISRRVNEYDVLEAEVKDDWRFIKRLSDDFKSSTFLIVDSNHHDFLETYIDSKQFMEDPQNILFISRLLPRIINNPKQLPILQIMYETMGYKIPKNIRFLNHREELRVGGKLVSSHGHSGVSGSRGSPRSFEKANIKAVTGHTHSPQLYSNGAVTGHNTDLDKQIYAQKGISKWLQANVSIDELNKFCMLVLDNNFKK